MKASHLLGLLALAVPLALAGCTGGTTDTKKGTAAQEYDVKGKVVAVAPDEESVTLDHEAIPALDMKAMTMKYRVESPKVLEDIQTGQEVRGRLKKQDGNYIITRLEKAPSPEK